MLFYVHIETGLECFFFFFIGECILKETLDLLRLRVLMEKGSKERMGKLRPGDHTRPVNHFNLAC